MLYITIQSPAAFFIALNFSCDNVIKFTNFEYNTAESNLWIPSDTQTVCLLKHIAAFQHFFQLSLKKLP